MKSNVEGAVGSMKGMTTVPPCETKGQLLRHSEAEPARLCCGSAVFLFSRARPMCAVSPRAPSAHLRYFGHAKRD